MPVQLLRECERENFAIGMEIYQSFQVEIDDAARANNPVVVMGALYEQGRVHHVGSFPKLEDECCTWDPLNQVESPNRVDALVHGLTDLLVHAAPPSYRPTSGLYKPRR